MKTRFLTGVLLIVMILTFSSFDIPKGWFATGNHNNNYQMGIDKGSGKMVKMQ